MKDNFPHGFSKSSIDEIGMWELRSPKSLVEMTLGEYGMVAPALHESSSILCQTVEDLMAAGEGKNIFGFPAEKTKYSDFGYGNDANPTIQQLRLLLTQLEGGDDSRSFFTPNGLSAIAFAIQGKVLLLSVLKCSFEVDFFKASYIQTACLFFFQVFLSTHSLNSHFSTISVCFNNGKFFNHKQVLLLALSQK